MSHSKSFNVKPLLLESLLDDRELEILDLEA